MPEPDVTDLPRLLAEHPRWRWLPGMVVAADPADGSASLSEMVVLPPPRKRLIAWHENIEGGFPRTIGPGSVPDLSAPGTVGGLLHLLAEAEGVAQRVEVVRRQNGDIPTWGARLSHGWHHRGATPGEALARALLDAWGPP